jgi:hypothetical protein
LSVTEAKLSDKETRFVQNSSDCLSEEISPSKNSTIVLLRIVFGRVSQKCGGFGACEVTVVGITVYGNASATIVTNGMGNYLQVSAYTSMPIPSTTPNCFFVDNSNTFGTDVAQGLGYSSITVVPGCYDVDFTNNVYGDILIPISVLQP